MRVNIIVAFWSPKVWESIDVLDPSQCYRGFRFFMFPVELAAFQNLAAKTSG